MKRFALICMMVVAIAAATWAASTTDKVVPLQKKTSSTSLQALLNDLQQQAAAKSSQGTPRVTWQSLLSTAQANKTNRSVPRGTMDVGNVKGGGAAPHMLAQPNPSQHLNDNTSSSATAPRVVAKPTQTPRLTGDVSNVSRGAVVPRVLSFEDQIDILEGQIDQALVKHETTARLYEQLNALYAQKAPQTDVPPRPTDSGPAESVPVVCGGDTCASATAITSLPFCVICNTENAQDNYQPICITGPSGKDVVFKYTPPTNQTVSISLCGSLFNTVLSVYDTCPSVPGTVPRQPICCSDDGCGPNNLQSCCPGLQLLAGKTYYIIVDGANPAAFGQYVLHVTLGRVCASAPCFSDNHCPYPNREVDANDGCGEPDLPIVACGDTLCGEIRPDGDRDWYKVVIPENSCRVLKIDVFGNDTPGFFPFGRGLDPRVSLYGSDCATLIGSDDDGGEGYDSRLITDCLPAGVYFIRVVGVEGATGPYVLALTCRACDCPLPPCVECPTNAVQEDEGCTLNSPSINGGCNDTPPQFGTFECGELLCGTLWERAIENGYMRDTDWYRFVVDGRDSVRFTVKANIPFNAWVFQTVGAAAPCDSFAFFAIGTGDTCDVITLAACLPAGTYYFALAAQFGYVFNCAHYLARMECLPCSELPSCIICPENGVVEDEGCTPNSASINGGCNDSPPQFGQVECNENLCGTFWMTTNDAGQQSRDTDWYRFVLAERDSVWFRVKADRAFQVDITRFPDPNNPCSYTVEPIAYGDSCQDVILAVCLPAGEYAFFVGPQFGFSDFNCGSYVAHMGCLPCGEPETCVPCPPNGIQEDEGCTPSSASINGGCNDTPPQFGQIHCGDLLCGTFWETSDGGFRDTDWYQFVLEERDSVVIRVRADKAFQTEILQVTGPNTPCNVVLASELAYEDSCSTVTLAACLPPGIYYFFVAPQFSLPNFDCGHYLARMECLPCTERQTCISCPEVARHEDEPCPNFPDNFNGGCDTREPHFSRILCNDLVCGTAFAGYSEAGNIIQDEDWYELILTEGDSLRFCMRADFDAIFAIFFAGLNPPCDPASRQLIAAGLVDSCGEVACIGACLPAGRYYLALAPIQATECGHYVIGTQCLPCQPTCFVCPENVPHEDEACLSYPDVTNGGCTNREFQHFSQLACNGAICGTSWYLPATTDSTSAYFDTDWYRFDLEERDSVRFVVRSDFPSIFVLASYRSGVVNCDSLDEIGELEVAPCQSLTAGICLPPGHYVLIMLPNIFLAELPPIWCGHYLLAALCEPCEGPCVVECPPNAAIEDEGCSPTAPNINGGCDSPPGTPQLFGNIACGETICGTSWLFQDPNGGYHSDSDWFQFVVTAARDSIVFNYTADFASYVAIVRLSSAAEPCPGEVVEFSFINPCQPTLFGLCLTPGLYSVLVRPGPGPVFVCGHYVLNMQCTQCAPCPEQWLVDGYDLGDLTVCYPTLPGNPAHGISGIAWLGQAVTPEAAPVVNGDNPTDDGVQYLHLPWTPCAIETVDVTVTGGPHYEQYARCDGQLYLNGWKDGNLDGDFCDTMWCGGAAAPILADEWIVQDLPVTPGLYHLAVRDPGVFDLGIYNGVFRWRLTSRPIGRLGFGLWATQCQNQQCGNFGADFLGEVEDYDIRDAQLDVSLTSFEAVPGDNQVTLRWVTVSETGNDYFRIMRNNSALAQVTSQGNGADRHVYTYTDDRAVNGATYTYTLVAVDQTGGGTILQTVAAAPSASAATITEYALHQNYPNPFNPTTNVVFDLVEPGFVSLKVYNLVGQVVATMVNGNLAQGQHTVSFDATNLPTGIYVYRLEVNGFSAARKMLLTK